MGVILTTYKSWNDPPSDDLPKWPSLEKRPKWWSATKMGWATGGGWQGVFFFRKQDSLWWEVCFFLLLKKKRLAYGFFLKNLAATSLRLRKERREFSPGPVLLGCPGEEVRTNGLFHLLINGQYIGVKKPTGILTFLHFFTMAALRSPGRLQLNFEWGPTRKIPRNPRNKGAHAFGVFRRRSPIFDVPS